MQALQRAAGIVAVGEEKGIEQNITNAEMAHFACNAAPVYDYFVRIINLVIDKEDGEMTVSTRCKVCNEVFSRTQNVDQTSALESLRHLHKEHRREYVTAMLGLEDKTPFAQVENCCEGNDNLFNEQVAFAALKIDHLFRKGKKMQAVEHLRDTCDKSQGKHFFSCSHRRGVIVLKGK